MEICTTNYNSFYGIFMWIRVTLFLCFVAMLKSFEKINIICALTISTFTLKNVPYIQKVKKQTFYSAMKI